jgi:hypothetical protein
MTAFRIAECTLRLDGYEGDAVLPLKYQSFACAGVAADVLVTLARPAKSHFPNGPLVFDSQSVWRVYDQGDLWRYCFDSPAFEPSVYKYLDVDKSYRRGVLSVVGEPKNGRRPHPLDVPLEQLLVSHHCSVRGAIEVHGCGLAVGAEGVLLSGFSGAGKSTSAELWASARPAVKVLSDDRVVIKRKEDGHRLFGTPWHGTAGHARSESAALRAVFFLSHGIGHRLTRLSPRVAAQELYRRTFPPVWQREAVALTIERCTAIAMEVPAFHFAFQPDAGAVEAIERCLQSLELEFSSH